MTKRDLAAIARERGMTGYGRMNKASLAKVLGIDLLPEPGLTEEQKKERRKTYRDRNRDDINDRRRQYNKDHPEKMRQYRRTYHEKWEKNVDALMDRGVEIVFRYCPRVSRHARVMEDIRKEVPLLT